MCSKALQTATAARNEPGDLNEAGLMPEMGEKGNGVGMCETGTAPETMGRKDALNGLRCDA